MPNGNTGGYLVPVTFKALDGNQYSLTAKEQMFARIYLETAGNQTIAALEAYEITNKQLCAIPWEQLNENDKIKRRKAEAAAGALGLQKYRKLQVRAYIDMLLAEKGYVENEVHLEHFKNIKQTKSLSAKNVAIDMYYKLKGDYAAAKVEHGIDPRLEQYLDKQSARLP